MALIYKKNIPFTKGYAEMMNIIMNLYTTHKPHNQRTPRVYETNATITSVYNAGLQVGDFCVCNISSTKSVYVCTAIATTSGVITGATWTALTKSGS
jgi:hypothetical protein